jgi:predicted phosphodiesterase
MSRIRNSFVASVMVGSGMLAASQGPDMKLPLYPNSVRFLVLGDVGTGDKPQRETANQIVRWRQAFPFDFCIMLGDNVYGSERPQDFDRKFVSPYRALLDANVEFYATLGNHDDPNQRYFKPYNLNGERYHTFTKGNVEFFVIDSNYLDPNQIKWLTTELAKSTSDWKIAYFHHPLYTSAPRGPEVELRQILEPLFVKYGVDVVFNGHEHVYERFKPQKDITYIIAGGSAKLSYGDTRTLPISAARFDKDRSFMIVEVAGDSLYFQTVSRKGKVVDEGIVGRRAASKKNATPAN